MQYENRIRKKCVLQRGKKIRFGFQKAFFQNVHLEKKGGGASYNQGRLIFGSIRYILTYIGTF